MLKIDVGGGILSLRRGTPLSLWLVPCAEQRVGFRSGTPCPPKRGVEAAHQDIVYQIRCVIPRLRHAVVALIALCTQFTLYTSI